MAHVQDRRATGRGWVAVLEDKQAPGGRIHKTFQRKIDAKTWLTEQQAKQQAGTYVTPGKGLTPCSERIEVYREVGRGNQRASTLETEDAYIRLYIAPTFGDLPIGEIDVETIDRWKTNMAKDGYSVETTKKAFRILSAILDYAVRTKFIAGNPCSAAKAPKGRRTRVKPLPKEQVAKISRTINPRYQLWVKFSAFSGLRAEESFALQVRHIDPDKPAVTVEQTIVEVRGKLVEDLTKTVNSERLVQIPKTVWLELLRSTEGRRPNDLVFTAPDGGPVRLRNFRKRFWYSAVVEAGLGTLKPCPRLEGEPCADCRGNARPATRGHYSGPTIHQLRHTAIALWLQNGTDLREVSRRAGHSRVAFTLDTYGWLLEDEEDPTMSRLDETFGDTFGDGDAQAA